MLKEHFAGLLYQTTLVVRVEQSVGCVCVCPNNNFYTNNDL